MLANRRLARSELRQGTHSQVAANRLPHLNTRQPALQPELGPLCRDKCGSGRGLGRLDCEPLPSGMTIPATSDRPPGDPVGPGRLEARGDRLASSRSEVGRRLAARVVAGRYRPCGGVGRGRQCGAGAGDERFEDRRCWAALARSFGPSASRTGVNRRRRVRLPSGRRYRLGLRSWAFGGGGSPVCCRQGP